MKGIKYFAIALLAFVSVSCEEMGPDDIVINPEQKQEIVVKQITLDAKKGNDEITRIYIGEATNEKGTIYHWNETDEVGVFALNTGVDTKNYEATIKNVVANDKNNARFVSFVEYDPENEEKTDLFIYWPYNSSNVIADAGSVQEYLSKTGVQIRTLSRQDQSVYNPVAGEENATKHPSVNITKFGAAFDMTTCDEQGVAKFELHHATAYLQFNLYGATSANSSTNYADGHYKVTDVKVRLGKVSGMVQSGLLADGSTFTPVNIAGNFTYYVPEYNAGDVKADDVKMLTSGGDDYVNVSLAEAQTLAGDNAPVPVFAVVNASNITASNVNAIEAVATIVEYNDEGIAVNSLTRTRYINMGGNVIKGGDYYIVKFKVNDPVQEATSLDAIGGSNCYIVPTPGKYLFHVNYPGNGIAPAYIGQNYSTLGLNGTVDADGKLWFFTEDNMENYEMRYLWASGTTFENIKTANPSYTNDQVVEEVVEVGMYGTNVMLDVKNVGEELNGNLVVALSKKGSNEIIWSWHIWFGRPTVQHFNYPASRPGVGINNEHWYILDRNIGAETAELGNELSYGLYYQLGRHTPFITPSGNGTWPNWNKTVFVNNYFAEGQRNWGIESMEIGTNYPYARPMTMNSAESRSASGAINNIYTYAWVAADLPAAEKSKTFFDPCPLGYKLPTTREWDNLKDNQWEQSNPVVTHSGVFGYAAPYNYLYPNEAYVNDDNFTAKYDSLVALHGDIAATLNVRMAAGDYFTHSNKGRTYYSTTLAGGVPTTTHFPNSGVIEISGNTATAKYIDETNGDANFALWAAGRLEIQYDSLTYQWVQTTTFSPHWFGPMDWENDSFVINQPLDQNGNGYLHASADKVDGEWVMPETPQWGCYVPWYSFGAANQKPYEPIGTRPYNIAGIDGAWGIDNTLNDDLCHDGTPENASNYAGQAAPVRCIREYNSTSATAE